jgi:hypothetical protein
MKLRNIALKQKIFLCIENRTSSTLSARVTIN